MPRTSSTMLLSISAITVVLVCSSLLELLEVQLPSYVFYFPAALMLLVLLRNITARKDATHQLNLHAEGFEITSKKSSEVYAERWDRADDLSAAPLLPTKSNTQLILRRTVLGHDRTLFSVNTTIEPGFAETIIKQHQAWLPAIKRESDPLAPYRHCLACVAKSEPNTVCKCGQQTPVDLQLVIIPALPRFDLYVPIASLAGPFLYFVLKFSFGKGSLIPFLMVIFAVPAMFALRRQPKPGERRVARLSREGYQFCHPNAPLNLRPWKRRSLHLHPLQGSSPLIYSAVVGRFVPPIFGLPHHELLIMPTHAAEFLPGALRRPKGFEIITDNTAMQ